MMNHNPHTPGPMYPPSARRPHDLTYNAQGHYSQNMYQYHPQHIPQPYHHHHHHPQQPQQWVYYNMQTPMQQQQQQRPYQQPYPAMMSPSYPMAQTSMSPRPHPPQHIALSSSVRSHSHLPPLSPVHSKPSQSPRASIPATPPAASPAPLPVNTLQRQPFYPPLPWYSVPEAEFPRSRARRRRIMAPQSSSVCVELPRREDEAQSSNTAVGSDVVNELAAHTSMQEAVMCSQSHQDQTASPAAVRNSSLVSTTPTSPQSVAVADNARSGRKIIPVVPVLPNISVAARASKIATESAVSDAQRASGAASNATTTPHEATDASTNEEMAVPPQREPQMPLQPKQLPKSWADLVRKKASITASAASTCTTDAISDELSKRLMSSTGGSKADIFSSFSVSSHDEENKICFLKPRGLINTGNMCYMNSILQALVFCVPFYEFLEQVRKRAAYSFKTETPMVDAMIMFIREFPVIDSASSTERLNLRLKDTELEDYGEAFVPEFVYDAIRRLPRFSSMRRGHQQDAEEFLGFLLEEMHEECVHVMKGFDNPEDSSLFAAQQGTSEDSGWLEVGPKQKAAVTRSAGVVETESPITKIFGGKLRSELRVPGAKNSVTLEPYQPLQLDIGSPHINNITEALKGLTRSEILHGDFSSPRGPGVSATKQVFVETLPPVLILHLKRFQYDNAGGTQKVWKKVGYPLELEIPKELFPPHKRGGIIAHGGLPRYRLISVVYHHGKNASAGHYTVDMRRQNDREWIRLDDTIIRRVKSEDVAEAGGEEDPRILAAALEQHKRDDSLAHANIFDPMRNDNEPHLQSGVGWSQVNGNINNASKKWSGIINGVDTPTATSGKRTPVGHYSLKDNKVAYILFYQRMHTEF